MVRGKENRKERKVYNLDEESGENGEDLFLVVFVMDSLFESFKCWKDQNWSPMEDFESLAQSIPSSSLSSYKTIVSLEIHPPILSFLSLL